MDNYYNIDIVVEENVYKKIIHSFKRLYSEFETKRKMLEDIIKLSIQYPEAYIVVSDNNTIIHNISYSKSENNVFTMNELNSMRDYSNYKSSSTIDYEHHIENNPWIIEVLSEKLKVLHKSYVFNSMFAKEYAIKQSNEHSSKIVMVENYGSIRAIFKNGEIKNDYSIPPNWVSTNTYSKKRWYSF